MEERTFDTVGRLTRAKNFKAGSTLVDFFYTLDAVGNPTQVVRAGSAAWTTTYAYDVRDRLTEVCFQASCPGGSDPFIRWTYDGVGNRLTETRPSGTTTYTYDAADELTQAGSTSFTYDSNGNETTAGSRTFTYDLTNRVASTTAGGSTTTYLYDGDGNRVRATRPSATTNYVWDVKHGLPQIALERDGAGALIRRYRYGNGRVSVTAGGSEHYYHYDLLGSVANVTSATGAKEWTYEYEPFGGMRSETQSDASASANVVKFTGELLDETGLYHLRARQYDPATGRFLAMDTAPVEPGEPAVSTYVYANNQPTVFVDPSGLRKEESGAFLDAVGLSMSPNRRGPVKPSIQEIIEKALECLDRECGFGKIEVFQVLIGYGDASPEQASQAVNSFEGPIFVRWVRHGWRFLRYYSNRSFHRGRYLTRQEFSDPVDCQEGLNVRRYGNYCDLQQWVVVTEPVRALTFFGRIKGSSGVIYQWVATRLDDFEFHRGRANWWLR